VAIPIIGIFAESDSVPNPPEFQHIGPIGNEVFRLCPLRVTESFHTVSGYRTKWVKPHERQKIRDGMPQTNFQLMPIYCSNTYVSEIIQKPAVVLCTWGFGTFLETPEFSVDFHPIYRRSFLRIAQS
jgi:hypothetical protein